VTASLLPLPDDPPELRRMIELWPQGWPTSIYQHPRSAWLSTFEQGLRIAYPESNSASRKLTARHYAPFPLAAGHDVP